jgi:predicted nucleic acid-binding protein
MIYFDTSFVVPLILPESTSRRIEVFMTSRHEEPLAISHWTRVELTSVLAREVRMRKLDAPGARAAESEFDDMITESFHLYSPSHGDFELARKYMQHYETGLRAGDAFHLAIASNNRVNAIYSLDNRVLMAGRQLGLPVMTLPSRS